MNVQAVGKPEGFEIKPRNLNFDIERVAATDWHGGSPVRTALFNALSLMFPVGEQFFIDSVKKFRGGITDPVLSSEIRGFTAQEAVHSREHRRYNEIVCAAAGLNVEDVEKPIRGRILWAEKHRKPLEHLAMTVAYEHLTAILSDAMFRNESTLQGAHPKMKELWLWHGLEETEHKAVAFDVYVASGGTVGLRRRALIIVTVNITRDLIRNMRRLLKNRKISTFLIWREAFGFIFGKHGALKGIWQPYRDFYRRSFHPWDHPSELAIRYRGGDEGEPWFI
ncbi:metal-dependent hydrolase [Parvibaculum sp.]|uniref:metal-dependent hydrolase n=1 Tax=Parvibaculum sp. TaxID=2024848 RepID=UPI003BAA0400